jgi:hypothetical protein
VSELSQIDFENLTTAQFEEVLPDLFANGDGKVSADPRLTKFLAANPDCAALVSDLETIAEHAKSLFEPTEEQEPSDSVWSNIASKLKSESAELDEPNGTVPTT